MTVNAIEDHVIVIESTKVEETTNNGIIMPVNRVDPQKFGKVVSVGEKVVNVKAGDMVTFHQAGGQAMYIDNTIYRVLKNNEIYGIVV